MSKQLADLSASPAIESLFVCSTRSDFVTDTARVSGVSYEHAAERYAAGFQSDLGELRVYVCPADIFDSLDGDVSSSDDVWSMFAFEPTVVWSLV